MRRMVSMKSDPSVMVIPVISIVMEITTVPVDGLMGLHSELVSIHCGSESTSLHVNVF